MQYIMNTLSTLSCLIKSGTSILTSDIDRVLFLHVNDVTQEKKKKKMHWVVLPFHLSFWKKQISDIEACFKACLNPSLLNVMQAFYKEPVIEAWDTANQIGPDRQPTTYN